MALTLVLNPFQLVCVERIAQVLYCPPIDSPGRIIADQITNFQLSGIVLTAVLSF